MKLADLDTVMSICRSHFFNIISCFFPAWHDFVRLKKIELNFNSEITNMIIVEKYSFLPTLQKKKNQGCNKRCWWHLLPQVNFITQCWILHAICMWSLQCSFSERGSWLPLQVQMWCIYAGGPMGPFIITAFDWPAVWSEWPICEGVYAFARVPIHRICASILVWYHNHRWEGRKQ